LATFYSFHLVVSVRVVLARLATVAPFDFDYPGWVVMGALLLGKHVTNDPAIGTMVGPTP
jgi:hypothetical protein